MWIKWIKRFYISGRESRIRDNLKNFLIIIGMIIKKCGGMKGTLYTQTFEVY